MLWNPREHLKVDTLVEVSQPDKLLDQASSEHITQVTLKEIGDDKTFMIAVSTENQANIFYTKSGKASVSKGKTVKRECTVSIGMASEQIINASIVNETGLSFVHGNVFAIKRSQVKLLDEAGKVQKEVSINGKLAGKEEVKEVKKDSGNYQVMGIEEEGTARVNTLMSRQQLVPHSLSLSLLDDTDNLESKLTSVSSKNVKISKSLVAVLTQSLTADDTETLDWVLQNRDDAVI